MKTIFSVCAIAAAILTYPCYAADGPPPQVKKITIEEAIALARQACQGHADVPADAPATVRETGGMYTVTFTQPYQEGVLHGDIYARVVLDSFTGKIIDGIEKPE